MTICHIPRKKLIITFTVHSSHDILLLNFRERSENQGYCSCFNKYKGFKDFLIDLKAIKPSPGKPANCFIQRLILHLKESKSC